MANQTTTTGNAFMPDIWATDILDFLKAELVLRDRVLHYDREIKSMGQSVQVPIPPQLVANDKAADTQVTPQNTAATKVSILIDKHKEATVIIEDILDIQSKYDLRRSFADGLSIPIREAIDSDIYDTLTTGAAATVGTSGTPITDAVVLEGKKTLDEAKAPWRDRTIAVSPAGESDMLAIDKYVRFDALGTGKAIVNGKVGTIYGFEVVMTQLVSGPSVMFQKQAMGIALQRTPRVQSQYKQEWLGWMITVDALYGVEMLRPSFAVNLEGSTS
jgi:N4-gp56 family major capsid protein